MSDVASAATGAAVSGGLGIIGSLVNYGLNKKLAAQQNQYNIDMWKMQADYNSPQAQMQRFQDAGLNPNLIYGQGSNGNMANAPQMVTPDAPELSKEMQELGRAFNIENLRTLVADRKKAEAEAKAAQINARRESDHYESDITMGNNYDYDTNTGQYVLRKNIDYKVPDGPGARYYTMQHLSDNYRQNSLIPFRSALLQQQKNYLVPQVTMANYEASHYPVSYWIGQGSKVAGALTSIPKVFSPLQWTYRRR